MSLLSGGEQARLLLARLMLKDANLLVLDEPTNDLDLATLNVLEESLKEFPGAILIVSHDRYFLDQIADQVIVPYDGQIEVFCGVGQWESWYRGVLQDKKDPGKASTVIKDSVNSAASPSAPEPASAEVKGIKKLSYKDQRDLDSMASNMEALEKELSQLNEKMTSNEVTSNAQKLTELTQQMAEIQAKIDILYARWAELEALQSS